MTGGPASRGLAGLLLGAVSLACSEPLEFADWTVPVPEGARVIEYADVPREDRDARVELVEDLVIGPRGDDPDYLLFRPMSLAVDDSGNVHVADMGNIRVQVYTPEGDHLRTLGQEGQGPGELQMPAALAVTAGTVVVSDLRNRRLSFWDLEGAHVGDLAVEEILEPIEATGARAVVTSTDRQRDDGTAVSDVVRLSLEGEVVVTYATVPEPHAFLLGDPPRIVMPQMTGRPSFASGPDGDVYVTPGDQYQVLAFDADGAPRWALRVARPPEPFGTAHQEAVLGPVRERIADLDVTGVEWPERLYVISDLAVDGHGHLYVFPQLFRDLGPERVPVEVYSRDGDRLFAGTMGRDRWSAARGDFVYELRTDEETGEQEVVRYRLVEPFD